MLPIVFTILLVLPVQHDTLMSTSQPDITYKCTARLDTDNHVLDATCTITCVNTIPLLIDTIFLTTYAHITVMQVIVEHDIDVMIDNQQRLKVPLKHSIEQGDSCQFTVIYRIDIPVHTGIFGYVPGHYEMTRWYPRICSYGEQAPPNQRHDQPGLFASYDVAIDLPSEYIIAATGRQIDPQENAYMDTYINSGTKTAVGTRKTVHFVASRVTDFVWVCDPFFMVSERSVHGEPVRFFYRPYDMYTWEQAVVYSSDVIVRYSDWFGDPPGGMLNIVQGLCQSRAGYPQVVFVNTSEDPLTRLFESTLAENLSRQWFLYITAAAGIDEQWFAQGLATYATIRYMEDRYGREHSLIKSSVIPSISLRYFHRANYYVMHTNELEQPITASPLDYGDVAFAYTSSMQSKPALVFFSLEKYIGREVFTDILRAFIKRAMHEPVAPHGFFTMLEDHGDEPLDSLYDLLVNTTHWCDWQVKRVTEHSVDIENHGELPLPTEVFVKTDSGMQVYRLDANKRMHTIQIPDSLGEIVSVAVDPTESLFDPYYWNNFYPRRIRIRPIIFFKLPSFSTYHLYWVPYPWYDSYDGVTANFYWFGDRFADFDFIRGGHQFLGGINYGFGSKRAYASGGYQTPLIFTGDIRMRIALNVSHSKSGDRLSAGLLYGIGNPLTSSPRITTEHQLVLDDVSSFAGLDSSDWSLGRNIGLVNNFRFQHGGWDLAIDMALALHTAGSDYEYLRTACAAQRTIQMIVPCKVRVFAGKVFGDAPPQEQLYLCGKLRINWLADVLFSQSGSLSPQEHIHIPGHGSMRGYQTLHIRSDQMYSLNLEFPSNSVIRVFTDVGYYDRFAFDAGLSLSIDGETVSSLPISGFGISANLPLYTYTDEPWAVRWSIGFSM